MEQMKTVVVREENIDIRDPGKTTPFPLNKKNHVVGFRLEFNRAYLGGRGTKLGLLILRKVYFHS